MTNEIDTERSLAQLKRFVVREMKSPSADWSETKVQNYTYEEKGFRSEYIKVLKEVKKKNDSKDKPYRIYLSDGSDEHRYELEDIGISKIRFYFLLRYVKGFCKRREELQKKEMLAYRWESFLKRNKVLNRDRKIDEILK